MDIFMVCKNNLAQLEIGMIYTISSCADIITEDQF